MMTYKIPSDLNGGGESDFLVSEVVDGVVTSDEDVTKDPQWTSRFRNIHSNETRKAGSRSSSRFLNLFHHEQQ